MFALAPSILAADFKNLGNGLEKIQKSGASYVHLDVMDGRFVPSISFGMPVIESIRSISNCVFDVHLMVEEPERYIDDFIACGGDSITIHAEATTHVSRAISQIKASGVKAGIALNPSTPLNVLDYILDQVDMVLIMTVNPGFGGQKYIDSSTRKITELRNLMNDCGLSTDIQVDGGITLDNVSTVIEAGANIIVAGSAVFQGDIEKNTKDFLRIMKNSILI
ncbi:ribulose-phosphate 3-epimerase [Candidatus Galacturonibacter soehngenii]|uniref:Ribulose-phosphate 3-epimerase n=1 Tax=Candidatus Galacturonatibacter soehngenii TaxID=2307010 RepID=A0A7V7QK54_9FIRM|nr:ribulose-phosphate 3-epimerase [Candidatus Galacturonibacter soehngenii]KAB1438130.1 ribulose-phosphate 3-epimerase [Candidatus Galacturonibacter soehngenii]